MVTGNTNFNQPPSPLDTSVAPGILLDNFSHRASPNFPFANIQLLMGLESLYRKYYGKINTKLLLLECHEELFMAVDTLVDTIKKYGDAHNFIVSITSFNNNETGNICFITDKLCAIISPKIITRHKDKVNLVSCVAVDISYVDEKDCNSIIDLFISMEYTFHKTDGARNISLKGGNNVKPKEIEVKFAVSSDTGVRLLDRVFPEDLFENIKNNYSLQVQKDITQLFTSLKDVKQGLVILHGAKGCGKTFIIRSILSEIDRYGIVCTPPSIFLQNIGLLSQVVLNFDKSVIILEDIGDMIAVGSQTSHLNEISNLLNLTDGLLSLLSNTIFILTFNYEIDKIDPALLRPGRCIANIEVGKLSYEQAQSLVPEIVLKNQDYSLAEVYELRRNGVISEERKPQTIGFLKDR